MPVIPIAQNRVEQRPLPQARLQAADFTAGTDMAARGAQQLAGGLADYGAELERADAAMDEATAKQLDLEFSTFERETLWNPETGFYSQQGQNALNARGTVEQSLQKKRMELLGKARTPRAKAMLSEVLGQRVDQSLMSVARYSQRQAEQYERDISIARIGVESENAVRYRDDPERREAALQTVRGEIISLGRKGGWAEERVNHEIAKATSDIHRGIAESIAVDDPFAAASYVEKHADELEPSTKLVLDKMLSDHLDEQETTNVVDAIRGVGTAAPSGPVKFNDLASAVEMQESRGQNGLESPAGALGVMQVMPATAKELCAELNIPYDPDRVRNDPEYCRRLGREYLAQMLQKYGGNSTLALAAYNAGPGNVDKWIRANGDPRKGQVSNEEWVARIPVRETRNYVPGVLGKVKPAGPRNAPRENDVAGQLARLDAIRDSLGQKVYERARSELLQAAALDRRLLDDQQEQLADQAWTVAMEPTFTSIRSIPPKVWAGLKPEEQRRLQEVARKNASGEAAGPNPTLMLELSDMASLDPDRFTKLDLRRYVGQLPPGDIEQMATLQRSIRGQSTKPPAAVTHDRIRSVTNGLAEAAGLSLTGLSEKKRPEMAARLEGFRRAVGNDVQAFVAENRRQPTDDEIRAFADKWLMQVRTPQDRWIGADLSDPVPLFEKPEGERIAAVDIPSGEREKIVAAARRHGIANPTEGQIAAAFMASRGVR
jgi:hypothetical protein